MIDHDDLLTMHTHIYTHKNTCTHTHGVHRLLTKS